MQKQVQAGRVAGSDEVTETEGGLQLLTREGTQSAQPGLGHPPCVTSRARAARLLGAAAGREADVGGVVFRAGRSGRTAHWPLEFCSRGR